MGETSQDMCSEYIDVNGTETQVIKVGNIRPLESRKKEQQHLFLIIPGNPGIPGYYEEFMQKLWEESGKKVPVWCVGHAGHVSGPKHSFLGWFGIVQQPPHAYTLEGQIMHKINFIKKHIPQDLRLILIGHSIGCYMILNLLSHISEFHVTRCFLLFPTIERMATTPNGRILTPVFTYLRWVLTGAVKVSSYFGPWLQQKLLEYHFSDSTVPQCGMQASMNLFNPMCVNNATYMAKIEMQNVTELQEDLLKKHLDKVSFYYGAVDKWCPKEYCHTMQAKFPEADIRLCEKEYPHAFVLGAGQAMAHILWDWVQTYL